MQKVFDFYRGFVMIKSKLTTKRWRG